MGGERQIEAADVRRTGRALALLRASHPEPTVMVTALAVALAVSTGRAAPGVVAVAALTCAPWAGAPVSAAQVACPGVAAAQGSVTPAGSW